MGESPHFEPRFIDYAVDNLRVKRNVEQTTHTMAKGASHRPSRAVA
jgi:hypothetical protein